MHTYSSLSMNQLWTTIGFRDPIKRTTEGYKVKRLSSRYCIDAAQTHGRPDCVEFTVTTPGPEIISPLLLH